MDGETLRRLPSDSIEKRNNLSNLLGFQCSIPYSRRIDSKNDYATTLQALSQAL
jgi:hypothetical protein